MNACVSNAPRTAGMAHIILPFYQDATPSVNRSALEMIDNFVIQWVKKFGHGMWKVKVVLLEKLFFV